MGRVPLEPEQADAELDDAREMAARHRHAQQVHSLGTVAGGVAHELNNILQGMFFAIRQAQKDVPAESPTGEALERALMFGRRGRELVRRVTDFGRDQREERTWLPLGATVNDALDLVRAALPPSVIVDAELHGTDLRVLGNAGRLHAVVVNLCTNGSQAMNGNGTLRVSLDAMEMDAATAGSFGLRPGLYAELVVTDEGDGIPEKARNRIFDPFFTTKPVGRGTGLGLSMVRDVVEAHEGEIIVESAPGIGTSFHVVLPAERGAIPEIPDPGHGNAGQDVDDE